MSYLRKEAEALPSISRDNRFNRTDGMHSPKYSVDVQDQVKLYKEEMRKKDELIQKLTSMEVTGIPSRLIDASLGAGIAAHSARSEVAALQVKLDALERKYRERTTEIDAREETIAILRREMELLKEDNARFSALNESLKKGIDDAEGQMEAYNVLKTRNSYAVASLQEHNRASQERVLELEARLKEHLTERERLEVALSAAEKKTTDTLRSIADIMHMSWEDPDKIIERFREGVQENHVLKGRIVTLQEALNATEMEQKASRETIMRLVSEVNREQISYDDRSKSVDRMQHELDKAHIEKKDLESQVALLEQRLEANQRTLAATKDELYEKNGTLAKLECEKREVSFSAESSDKQMTTLLESLATLLSSAYSMVPPTEEAIKDRVKALTRDVKENATTIEALETRLKNVTKQFECQYENSKDAVMKARRAEDDFLDLRERIRILEGEMAAADVLRDGLRADKEKFFKYMQRLGEILKMDRINADIGFDMVGEAILARAEQLMRLEVDAIADRSSAVHNMHRKLKALKDQLESKDLHLDLLRKKIAALEERGHERTDLERERDHENVRSKKIQKMLEKSQRQLEDARSEIVELKAQLLECSNLKLTVIEQDKELQSLEKTLEKLEHVRQRQAKHIRGLKDEVDSKEKDLGQKAALSEGAVQGLTSELRTTKAALEEVRRKERQLFEFRAVIGRMLGLDLDSLAIPDYEIINRLERLVQAHQSNVYTAFSVDQGLRDMEEGFRSGFEDTNRAIGRSRRTRSPSPQRHAPSPATRDQRRY